MSAALASSESFIVNSGRVVYGPVISAAEGAVNFASAGCSAPTDGPDIEPLRLGDGTITQSKRRFLANAKNGKWRTSRVFQADFAHEARTWSWLDKCSTVLIHHEGADAADVARECALTGFSDGERHGDFDIRFINRYDWGSQCSAPHAVRNILAVGQPRTSKAIENLLHGSRRSNFCFLDAEDAVCNLKEILQNASVVRMATGDFSPLPLRKDVSTESNGVFVQMRDMEYEVSWLAFDRDGLLIGLVYDLYTSFSEGDFVPLKVEDSIIFSLQSIEGRMERLKMEQTAHAELVSLKSRYAISSLLDQRGSKDVSELAGDFRNIVLSSSWFQIDSTCKELLEEDGEKYSDILDILELYHALEARHEETDSQSGFQSGECDAQSNEINDIVESSIAEEQTNAMILDRILLEHAARRTKIVGDLQASHSDIAATETEEERCITEMQTSGAMRVGALEDRLTDMRFQDGCILSLIIRLESMRRKAVERKALRAAQLKGDYLRAEAMKSTCDADRNMQDIVLDDLKIADIDVDDDENDDDDELEAIRDEFSTRAVFHFRTPSDTPCDVACELNKAGVDVETFGCMLHYWLTDYTDVEQVHSELSRIVQVEAAQWSRRYSINL